MYTQDELVAMNPLYHTEHGLTAGDVFRINQLVKLIEEARVVGEGHDPFLPIDGDLIICMSPEGLIVSEHGHIQRRHRFSDWMTVCTRPMVPFIDTSLYSDAGGGYWVNLEEEHIPLFTYKGRQKKTFKAWGHMGRWKNGAIDFQAEGFVWELVHPSFY